MKRIGALARVMIAVVPGLALATACETRGPVAIGVVLGAEGTLASQLASDSAGAIRGGAAGQPIELRVMRGAFAGRAEPALAAAESLTRDPHVIGVVGHANSSASLAASQVYNARRVVQIAPTTTAPQYAQAGPYSFRLVGGDERQARFIAEQLQREHARRIAMVYVNDDYGRALRRLLAVELTRHGIRPVYEGTYAEEERVGEQDLVASLVTVAPDVLVWLGRSPYYGRIAAPLRAALPNVGVLASDGFGGITVARDTLHRFDGVRYVRLVDLDGGAPPLQALRERYAKAGGGQLDDQAALSYDAVMLLAQGIREAGADREALRAWLRTLGRSRPPYAGVTGPISFTEVGDRVLPYTLVTVRSVARPSAAAGR